jgi:hypothetical protein
VNSYIFLFYLSVHTCKSGEKAPSCPNRARNPLRIPADKLPPLGNFGAEYRFKIFNMKNIYNIKRFFLKEEDQA